MPTALPGHAFHGRREICFPPTWPLKAVAMPPTEEPAASALPPTTPAFGMVNRRANSL